MAFTYVLTTTRGKVRLLVGDNQDGTQYDDYILSDDEIDVAIAQGGGDVDLSAAEACRMIAAFYMQGAPKINIDGSSFVVDRTKTPGYWFALAEKFDKRANSKPFSATQEISDDDWDLQNAWINKWDFRPHDAPEADSDN